MAELKNEGVREACGVFGIVASGEWPSKVDVANIICLGLVGLQHRGQESAGIVTSCGKQSNHVHRHHGMGLVSTVFTEDQVSKLKGNIGIGHTRYSTAGSSDELNCQPFVVETLHGLIALAHNGELVNANPLKQKVLEQGVGLSTGSDSELITQLLASSPPEGEPDGPDWVGRISNFMSHSLTSYSLAVMAKDCIYAIRDPFGNRPLCLGKLLKASHMFDPSNNNDDFERAIEGWIVSSESCSFQSIGAVYHREVLPGEIVKISKDGIKSMAVIPRPGDQMSAFCIFEYVYFARPDSVFEGQMVYTARQRCGRQLAVEAFVEADLVSTVPESATPAALGFSQQTGIPYVEVLTKNRYIGRTFIQPSMRLRQLGVAKKFGALTENLLGKRVILVDDSIVRGNTMGPIIRLLKKAGAKEVHVRIASPPLKYPCYMGINIPTKHELIANRMSIDEMAKHLNADSVVYLSVDGLKKAVRLGMKGSIKETGGHCMACLTEEYPVPLDW